MSEYIKLVQGDTRPALTVTLTDASTGDPIDITGCTPALKFKAAGADVLTGTIPGLVVSGPQGICIFHWGTVPGILDAEPGVYQGEIELTFPDASVQTAFDVLKFKLRAQF